MIEHYPKIPYKKNLKMNIYNLKTLDTISNYKWKFHGLEHS